MYFPNSVNSAAVSKEMKKVFKKKMFHTKIPMDENAAVAPATRQSVLDYKPNSAVSAA